MKKEKKFYIDERDIELMLFGGETFNDVSIMSIDLKGSLTVVELRFKTHIDSNIDLKEKKVKLYTKDGRVVNMERDPSDTPSLPGMGFQSASKPEKTFYPNAFTHIKVTILSFYEMQRHDISNLVLALL
jgi:hypothetical protein